MSRFQVLGVNDARDYCECCGKKNLKRVVWILDNETGEERHFGTTCAMQPAKGFNLEREIKDAISEYECKVAVINARARDLYKARGGKYVPHPTKAHTWTHASPGLYAACRAEVSDER